jgi:hypothetical protein
MKLLKTLLFSVIVLVAFTRCSTDVDIYSDYKDITIVYGLLDRSDDTVWLKVTKAFLGSGNALHFAQNPDSSNYPYKLDVELNGVKNGSVVQKLVFDTITVHNKQAGDSVFYYPDQLLYYCVPSGKLNTEAIYHLSIKKSDGNIEASTPVIPDFAITYPVSRINFNYDKEVQWISARNGKRYEISLVFYYRELWPGSSDTVTKSVSWSLGVEKSSNTNGGEQMGMPYSGQQFYNILDKTLEKDPNVKRWSGPVEVIIGCGSQDFDTYYEVNNVSGGMLEEAPQFSNIKGDDAMGLLAARHSVTKELKLSVATELTLVNDYNLGFEMNP